VAAGLGVSLVPDSVRHMTVEGAVYRPRAREAAEVELAVARRREDDAPVVGRALEVVRGAPGRSSRTRPATGPDGSAQVHPHTGGRESR
jgi:hypothetical protein